MLSVLANLLDVVPPIMSKFAAISSFFAKVLSQAEHFLRLDTETVTTECGVFVKKRNTVTGGAAIAHCYAQFQCLEKGASPASHLEDYKRFSWLLTPQQTERVDTVRDAFVRSQRTGMQPPVGPSRMGLLRDLRILREARRPRAPQSRLRPRGSVL